MKKIISFDIKSDFGFFKKPEINKVYLTYTLPPKPLVLGILGAILGLKGLKEQYYEQKKTPEYYDKLKDLKIGIIPNESVFPFNKIMNKYNSKNSYFYELENLPITEQLIIKPSYKIYIYTNEGNSENFQNLIKLLKNSKTMFVPYMGKNDFLLEVENLEEYTFFEELKKEEIDNISIDSAHIHRTARKRIYDAPRFVFSGGTPKINKPKPEFDFYENIPIGYDKNMLYCLETLRYTSKQVKKEEINLEKSKLIKVDNKTICVF